MPMPPPCINPVYLNALTYNNKSAIIISHAHGDHFDIRWLKKCCRDTIIVFPKYSPNHIGDWFRKNGFNNLVQLETQGDPCQIYQVLSTSISAQCLFNSSISLSDSMIGIEISHQGSTYYILHGNDCCQPIPIPLITKIKDCSKTCSHRIAFFQTNIASSHPLAYPQYSDKQKVLEERICYMLRSAAKNTQALGFDNFASYAGYSCAYVEGQEYHKESISPFPETLKHLMVKHKIMYPDLLLDLEPGSRYNLATREISKILSVNACDLIKVSKCNYGEEGNELVARTDSKRFNDYESQISPLDACKDLKRFFDDYNSFIDNQRKLFPRYCITAKFSSLLFVIQGLQMKSNASLIIEFNECKITHSEVVDEEIAQNDYSDYNKVFVCRASQIHAICKLEIPLENIYTGYGAKVYRHPLAKYNRDLLVALMDYGNYMNAKAGSTD